ncbi:hypothetical protein ACFCV3_38630 [Kribbella sp. NPDC056345]|uniref:hypothetical protein n=1 Tax=Kribbella sp. NPDC056345 TaxID=3345789 RepID=UPI0035D6CCFD
MSVGDLELGQVISSAEQELAPAVIEAMTAGVPRQLQLRDVDSGERLDKIYRLDADAQIVVHDYEVEHHVYTNLTAETLKVQLGPDAFTVGPGETFHHTGRARPDIFPPDLWNHEAV